MDRFLKGMLFILLIIYVISPIDLVPGPVDDIIAVAIGIAANKRIGNED